MNLKVRLAIKEIDSVGIQHSDGGRLAAEYLLSQRAETFCYFGLEQDEKFIGFKETLLQNGISEKEIQIIGNQDWYFNSIKTGAMILRNYIRNNIGNKKTGLFCVNDLYATHALSEAHDNGINVPEQLSIVGFDDTMLCDISYPKLTSIHQPLEEIAKIAFELLLHRINSDSKCEPEVITLSPTINIHNLKPSTTMLLLALLEAAGIAKLGISLGAFPDSEWCPPARCRLPFSSPESVRR